MRNIDLISTLCWRKFPISVSEFKLIRENIQDINQFNIQRFISNKKLINWLAINNWVDLAKKELEWCLKNNIQWVTYGDDDYPKEFYELHRPPILLTYKGNSCWNNNKKLSVVGSRDPEPYILRWLDIHLTTLLKENNLTVVSGGARGIDQKAHQVSLRTSSPTICLLPSGLKNIYPNNLSLYEESIIEGGGALISQFSPESIMYKGHFHIRNQLIASLGEVSLIAEARKKSGTMITAKRAIELGREVAVLPSFPDSQKNAGGLDLLYDGAHLIRNKEDLELLLN